MCAAGDNNTSKCYKNTKNHRGKYIDNVTLPLQFVKNVDHKIICDACLFAFDEKSTLLAEITQKKEPQNINALIDKGVTLQNMGKLKQQKKQEYTPKLV